MEPEATKACMTCGDKYADDLDACPRCGQVLYVDLTGAKAKSNEPPPRTEVPRGDTRPVEVAVIGWLVTVAGCLAVGLAALLAVSAVVEPGSDTPPLVPILMSLTTLPIGIGLLRGRNWARWAYVGLGAAGLVASPLLGWSESGFRWLVSLVVYVVVVLVLFSPAASAFFRRRTDRAAT